MHQQQHQHHQQVVIQIQVTKIITIQILKKKVIQHDIQVVQVIGN
jgi:hypothetical protein